MSKIFEEALADAKKLREVAEENAQKAILESVTPQIKHFIEKTLLEQDEESYEEVIKEENSQDSVVLDESAIKSLVKMLGAENIYTDIKQKNAINEAFGTALNNLNGKDRLRMTQLLEKINENKNILTNDDIINDQTNSIKESMNMRNREKMYEVDLGLLRESVNDRMYELADAEDENKKDEMNDFGDDISMEEMDSMDSEIDMIQELRSLLEQEAEEEEGEDTLPRDEVEAQIEELIADLGLDIGGAAAGEAPDDEAAADLGELEDIDMDSEDIASEEESEEESEELPLNEVFDVDPKILKQELRNVKRMLSEGKMDHHFGGKGSGKTNHQNAFGGPGAKKTGHQKSFGGGAYGKDVFVNPPASLLKLNEAIRKLSRTNRSQKEKLNKYRGAVNTLREQLEDLNLFNAKLLYVNKLLQNKYLNESQKKSVIKALDEAKTLSETKALYKSLTESLGSSKTLNESKKFGSSSRATTSGSGLKTKSVGETDRWAKLAGLK